MRFNDISPHLIYINYLQCEKGFYTKERFLANPYFLYVHKGSGRYIIDGKSYAASTGDLFYCRQGVGNTIIADTQDPFLLSGLDFDYGTLRQGESFTDFTGFPPRGNLTADGFSRTLIGKMIDVFSNRRTYSGELCDGLLKSFLFYLADRTLFTSREQEGLPLLLSYLSDHSHREVTLSELSGIFNYHPSTIERMIRSGTGLSVRQYQIDQRIKKAMDLLVYSRKPISEIAGLCGYGSVFYFSRQFKEKTGRTPSEVRNIPR